MELPEAPHQIFKCGRIFPQKSWQAGGGGGGGRKVFEPYSLEIRC